MVEMGAFGYISAHFRANNKQIDMCANFTRCRLFLDARRPLKDGTFPVKVRVPYGKQLLIETGISVDLDDWNAETGTYTGPQAKYINSSLNGCLSRIAGRVQELRDTGRLAAIEPPRLRKILEAEDMDAAVAEDGRLTFWAIADRFIATKKPGSTRTLYLQTLEKVRTYAGDGPLYIEDMGRAWLAGLEASIEGKVNTRSVHLRNVRAICNFALDEEYTDFYPFRKFKIKSEETRKRALTLEQMRAIRDLKCEPWQELHRDMFLLIFYLIGINPVDLFTAPKDALKDGRLEYRRAKTGRLYSIKVEDEAKALISKYKGKLYLLSILDNYGDYKWYLHHLDNALKTLGMKAPMGHRRKGKAIEPDLSAYWARHTWATMAAEIEVADPTISLALGHSTAGHRTTAVYIKRNSKKIDDANRRVIDHLNADIRQ